ncbi:MAG TPA: EthD family reductase [Rhodocyclaceae bacterium]|nr:EthD family reductase [Rhodocyclaceae bacterium]
MVKILVLYPPQPDMDAFESHFFSRHAPLAKQLPGLVKMECARAKTGPEAPNPFAFVAELYFENRDALKAALKSPQMAACVADVQANIPSGNTVYLSEDIRS